MKGNDCCVSGWRVKVVPFCVWYCKYFAMTCHPSVICPLKLWLGMVPQGVWCSHEQDTEKYGRNNTAIIHRNKWDKTKRTIRSRAPPPPPLTPALVNRMLFPVKHEGQNTLATSLSPCVLVLQTARAPPFFRSSPAIQRRQFRRCRP